jgi:hypothetical protein
LHLEHHVAEMIELDEKDIGVAERRERSRHAVSDLDDRIIGIGSGDDVAMRRCGRRATETACATQLSRLRTASCFVRRRFASSSRPSD